MKNILTFLLVAVLFVSPLRIGYELPMQTLLAEDVTVFDYVTFEWTDLPVNTPIIVNWCRPAYCQIRWGAPEFHSMGYVFPSAIFWP